MNRFPMDLAAWQRGLTLDGFVAGMKTYQAEMRRRLREVELTPADRDYFAAIRLPVRALAMTEDWCGDSLMNVPILARIVEAAPQMELRLFIRAESPDLNAYYASRGITHIPVFGFLGADWNEIGTWVERPQAAHARVAEWRARHPEFEAIRTDPSLTPDQRRTKLRPITASLLGEMEKWYADNLQSATVAEIKAILAPLTR